MSHRVALNNIDYKLVSFCRGSSTRHDLRHKGNDAVPIKKLHREVANIAWDVLSGAYSASQRMAMPDLAAELNLKGFRTKLGMPYKGKRGTYYTAVCSQRAHMNCGNKIDADAIATAFTLPYGGYAYN